jgi:rhamnosyltransferase
MGPAPGPSSVPAASTPRIYGIIVTHQPDERSFRETLLAARDQVDRLLIVDNSTSPSSRERVIELVRQSEAGREGSVSILAGAQGNVGLARALNAGLARGLQEGFDLFLILDQDSVLAPGAVDALRQASVGLHQTLRYVVLAARNVEEASSPVHRLLSQLYYRSEAPTGKSPAPSPLAMTSGLLLDSGTLRRVGFFDESLFLDAVDHEYCLRSWRDGVPIYLVPTATIRHREGQSDPAIRGRIAFDRRHADAGRLYYVTRDSLKVVRRYWRARPFICGTFLGMVGARAVIYGPFRREPPRAFRSICRGLVEFLRTTDRPSIPQAG